MGVYLAEEIAKNAVGVAEKAAEIVAAMERNQPGNPRISKLKDYQLRFRMNASRLEGLAARQGRRVFECLHEVINVTDELCISVRDFVVAADRVTARTPILVNASRQVRKSNCSNEREIADKIETVKEAGRELKLLQSGLKDQVARFHTPGPGGNVWLIHLGGERTFIPSHEFQFCGPGGMKMELKLSHVKESGGHMVSLGNDPSAVGKFYIDGYRVTNETLDGGIRFTFPRGEGKVYVVYQPTLFCGTMQMEMFVEQERQGSLCIHVKYPGLEELKTGDHPALCPYQGEREDKFHPSRVSHFGKPELISRLKQVGDRFKKFYSDHRIFVNDMSLPWGGLFKTYNNLKGGSHKTHLWGDDVDISFNRLRDNIFKHTDELPKQRIKLQDILVQVFGKSSVDFHGPELHWHCSLKALSKQRKYKNGSVDVLTK